jgi:hypothetical protein
MKWLLGLLVFLLLSIGMHFYYSSFKEYSLEEMQGFAQDEFEFIYRRPLRKDFRGPFIEQDSKDGVEFLWYKINGCDTTKVFIYVQRKGVGEHSSSELTIKCD